MLRSQRATVLGSRRVDQEMSDSQTTNTVLAIRPCRFQSNPLTAPSNTFQANSPWQDLDGSNKIAQQQFDGLMHALDRLGVRCVIIEDTPVPHTPDSIFPNNWISTHADGSVVLYPMEATNRRTERRVDILELLQSEHGFTVSRTVDLSAYELQDQFLEGTGSLVLDRTQRIAYACNSSRTHAVPLDDFAQQMAYSTVSFDSVDPHGTPIYHTNVMMCVGRDFAVVCDTSIVVDQRSDVLEQLEAPGRRLISIGYTELKAFAGNMLALQDSKGQSVIALSKQAFDVLSGAQRRDLEKHGSLAIADIRHIEVQSGGGVRCMLAEIHLPAD